MDNKYIEYLNVAKDATTSAGKYLAYNFRLNHDVKFKSKNDILLAVDGESEAIILNIIKRKYPLHNFLAEESGRVNNGSDFTWYIDPLDGTNNYSAGIPYFSISIALELKGEIIIGVIFNPVSNQFFEASKNYGAFFNGKQFTTTVGVEMQKSVCSFIQGHLVASSKDKAKVAKGIDYKLINNFRRVINTWAPSLDWALLAFGGIDALISFESEYEDMYAGLLIAKEAGIIISNFNGATLEKNKRRILASKKVIYPSLLKLMAKL